jgi:hypothetical protein
MPSKKNIKATQVVKAVDDILAYHEEPAVEEEPVEETIAEEPVVEEKPVKKASSKKKSAKEVIEEKVESEPDVYDRAFNDISDEILNVIQGLTKDRTLSATAFNKIKASLTTTEIKKNIRTVCENHFPVKVEPVPVVEKVKAEKKPRKKAENDSSVPKKPLTAYILFCNATRDEIKNENPEMKFVDITRELGSRWNNLSAEDKAVYTELHDKDVERYEQEMKASGVDPAPKKEKAVKEKVVKEKIVKEKVEKTKKAPKEAVEKKPKESSTEPKRGMSAYIYFCKEMRPVVKAEIPDIASNEILKELGRRWQLLSDDEKKPFNAMASAGKVEKKVEEKKVIVEKKVEEKKVEEKKTKKAPVEESEEELSEEELEDEEE